MLGKILCVLLMTSVIHSLPMDDDGVQSSTVSLNLVDLSTSKQTFDHIPVFTVKFVNGFIQSFTAILASELGDKTFFIAAIMAMRHSRITVFIGAISALALMTLLSGNKINS